MAIVQATTSDQMSDARMLMRAFVTWHRQTHTQDRALIDRYFDPQSFERELAELPGGYAAPRGRLLVAQIAGYAAGCVALRDLGDGICEMTRMFVPPMFRGLGVGRALADRLIGDARKAGYTAMRLDTSKRQGEAIRLYERAGFKRIPPYYALDAELEDWLLFFERRL